MNRLRKFRRSARNKLLLDAGKSSNYDVTDREISLNDPKWSVPDTSAQQRAAVAEPAPTHHAAARPVRSNGSRAQSITHGSITRESHNAIAQQPLSTDREAQRAGSKSSSLRAHSTNADGVGSPLAQPNPSSDEYNPVRPWPEPPEDYNAGIATVRASQAPPRSQQSPRNVGLWTPSLFRAIMMITRIDTSYARKAEAAFWPFLARYTIRSEFEVRMGDLGEQLEREKPLTKPVTEREKGIILASASDLLNHVHASLRDEGSALEADEFQAALETFRKMGGFRFKPKPKPDPTDGLEENAEIADRLGPGTYAGQRSREAFMREMGGLLNHVDSEHEILLHPPFGDKDWGETEAHERKMKAWGKMKADEAKSPDL